MQNLFDSLNANSSAVSAFGSVISALSSIVALIIAGSALRFSKRLLEENRLMRLAGTEPEVVAYIQPDEKSLNVLMFYVENVGNGPAFDVNFIVDFDQAQWKERGVSFNTKFGEKPITVIPQGKCIRSYFGLAYRLFEDEIFPEFNCRISYKNIDEKPITRSYSIDVGQFRHMSQLRTEDVSDVVKVLNKIQSTLARVEQGGFLQTVNYTPVEREQAEQNLFDSIDPKIENIDAKAPTVKTALARAIKWWKPRH